MDIRPNHTIYINNISDKVKKEGERVFPRCVRTSARVYVFPHCVTPGVQKRSTLTVRERSKEFGFHVTLLLCSSSDTAQRTAPASPIACLVLRHVDLSCFSSWSCRAEAFSVRALLSVRSDHRHCCHEDHEDEGTGVRRL